MYSLDCIMQARPCISSIFIFFLVGWASAAIGVVVVLKQKKRKQANRNIKKHMFDRIVKNDLMWIIS